MPDLRSHVSRGVWLVKRVQSRPERESVQRLGGRRRSTRASHHTYHTSRVSTLVVSNMVNRAPYGIEASCGKTETGKKRSSFSKFCTAGHRLVGGWPVDPARKKVRKSSQLFRRLNQAQEQQRAGQTGRDGKRCAALLGLTRRGWHPAGRGQLPGSTTGKATTEALAVDAICLPSDMLQDRI